MAAGTIPMNATDVLVSITEDSGTSYDTVGYATSCSVSWSMDVRDITTKSSGGKRAVAPGKSSASMSFDGLVTYNTETDIDKPNDIYTIANSKTEVGLKVGSANPGEYDMSADGYFSSYTLDAGVEDNHTYSASFEVNGDLTQAVVS